MNPEDWKKQGKATPGDEADLIREMKRLIEKKQLRAEVVDKRPTTKDGEKPGCSVCDHCPCMFIG